MKDSVEALDLRPLEEAVVRALDSGDGRELPVLGYGEITVVLSWPRHEPRWACKRLPVFDSPDRADRYGATIDRYVAVLRERGVDVQQTTFEKLALSDYLTVGYAVQPLAPPGAFGPSVLRSSDPDPEHPFLASVMEAICAVADERVAIDGQVSNWAWIDGGLRYFDITTPLLRDDSGVSELDLDVLLGAQPWVLRGLVRRFVAPGVLARFHDPRNVMLDLAGNLLKERLDPWLPGVLHAANRLVSPPITADEVRAFYRSDARIWELMLRLRRLDRFWRRTVRRGRYPYLLPGPIER